MHPSLEPLFDDAIRDTIAHFEATGSPVITRRRAAQVPQLLELLRARPAQHGARRLQDPVRGGPRAPHAAAHRRHRSATRCYADQYLDVAQRYATSAGQAGRHLAVGAEPALSGRGHPRLLARAVHRGPAHASTSTEVRRCLEQGAHAVQIDFTEGRLAIKLDPTGDLLASFIDLNNLALARFTAQERQKHRRPHLPRRRPRLDPQRRRRLRRAAAEPAAAQRDQLLRRAGRRARPRARARDDPRPPASPGSASSSAWSPRSIPASRPPRRCATASSRRPSTSRWRSSAPPTTAASRPSATTPRPPRDTAFAKIAARVRRHRARRARRSGSRDASRTTRTSACARSRCRTSRASCRRASAPSRSCRAPRKRSRRRRASSSCSTRPARRWPRTSICRAWCRPSPTPAPQLSGAQFGAFFYTVTNAEGERVHAVHAVRGAARGLREVRPPAQHPIFAPTFAARA